MVGLKEISNWSELSLWLTEEEQKRLAPFSWLAWGNEDFLALFLGLDFQSRWEAHWWSRESAKSSLTDCKSSIKMFFKKTGVPEILGITPCVNIKALKMAKLLGFQPLGFKKNWLNEVCLVSIKENNE